MISNFLCAWGLKKKHVCCPKSVEGHTPVEADFGLPILACPFLANPFLWVVLCCGWCWVVVGVVTALGQCRFRPFFGVLCCRCLVLCEVVSR